MADQVININMLLKSNIDSETKKALELYQALQKADKAAQSIGGTSGSRMAAAKASSSAMDDRGIQRGTTGAGGVNDSKDFARQAQGLGGLVHVYATFAANIFAVSAAFTALSKAADYTNMVEGLNQLGAASGKNLGSMAKHVADLTDGAVSLKQAMEATAQASAAGLSGDQLYKLTDVAKKASQALGRDVGDSLSRLSRGITKIEPELLDELGIMVKVDKAAADYARTLGKTASSLTDFEKRQSFAIAVLEQGNKKFGEINIDANPYNKLQSSFVNILYSGGELLNKVLGPVAKILGESPGALAAVMAGIASMLVSKAIPALSQWRSGLVDAAKAAEDLAKKKKDAFIESQSARAGAAAAVHDEAASQYVDKIRSSIASEGLFGAKSKTSQLFAGAFSESKDYSIAEQQVANKIKSQDKLVAKIKQERDAIADTTSVARKAAESRLADAEKLHISYVKMKQDIEALMAEQTAAQSKAALGDVVGTQEKLKNILANRAERKAAKLSLLADATENASTMGVSGSWDQFKKDLVAKQAELGKTGNKLNVLETSALKAGAGIRIIGVAISEVMSVAAPWLMLITALVGAFQLLDGWLSSSAKQVKEFEDSVSLANSSFEGVDRTLASIARKPIKEMFGAESTQAAANALNEVSSALNKVEENLGSILRNQNSWDRFWDGVWGAFGKDNASKAVDTFSKGITESLRLLTGDELKNAKAKLKEAGISDTSKSGITNAFKGLSDDEVYAKIKRIAPAIDQISKAANNSASSLTNLMSLLDQSNKDYDTLFQSFATNDPFFKLGVSVGNLSTAMAKLSTDGSVNFTGLHELVNNVEKLKTLPKSAQDMLMSAKDDINKLNDSISIKKKLLQEQRDELATNRDKLSSASSAGNAKELLDKIKFNQQNIAGLSRGIEEGQKKAAEAAGKIYNTLVEDTFKQGSELIAAGLKNAAMQASLTIAKAYGGGLTGAGASDMQYQLQLKEISIQEANIKLSLDMQRELKLNTLAIEEANLLAEQAKTKEGSDKFKQISQSLQDTRDAKYLVDKGFKYSDLQGKSPGVKSQLQAYAATSEANKAELQKTGAQKVAALINKQLNDLKEINREKQESLDRDLEAVTLQQSQISQLSIASSIYSEDLENLKKKLLLEQQSIENKKEEANWQATLGEYALRYNEAKKAGDKRGMKDIADSIAQANLERTSKLDSTKAKQQQAIEKQELDTIKAKAEYTKYLADLEDSIASAKDKGVSSNISKQKTYNQMLFDYGKISEDTYHKENTALELKAQNLSYISEKRAEEAGFRDKTSTIKTELDLLAKKNVLTEAEKDQQISLINRLAEEGDRHKANADAIELDNKNKAEAITLQGQYAEALASTEATMKRMEATGSYSGQYFGALADNFKDKLTAMVKSAKSAGDVFSSGLIGAMDTTIDKFFDMMQKGELTFKGIVDFAKNAVSNVFRDTASQLIKNTAHSLLTSVMGPTNADDVMTRVYDATTGALKVVMAGATGLSGYGSMGATGGLGSEVGRDFKDAGAGLGRAADTQEAASKTFGENVTGLFSGQMTVMEAFKGIVGNFGDGVRWMVSGLGGILGGLGSVGGGGGGGILGSLLGPILGSFLPGAGVAADAANGIMQMDAYTATVLSTGFNPRALARGGVIDSADLSKYSNTVVSSPTLFAFAKGSTGLMGEAGPEAIVPLKRDAAGNLGIRGGGNSISNDIQINITIDKGGNASSNDGQAMDNMANGLGQAIKAAVSQELMKQARPGGLLAR